MKFKHGILSVVTVAVMSISSFAVAKNISTYNELVSTLKSGHNVNAVIDVSKCKYLFGKTNEWNETLRGVRIDDLYERIAPDLSTGKNMHLIAAVSHDFNGDTTPNSFVLIRTLLRVFENNSVELIDQEFDTRTGNRKDFTAMVCQLSTDGSGGATLVTHG